MPSNRINEEPGCFGPARWSRGEAAAAARDLRSAEKLLATGDSSPSTLVKYARLRERCSRLESDSEEHKRDASNFEQFGALSDEQKNEPAGGESANETPEIRAQRKRSEADHAYERARATSDMDERDLWMKLAAECRRGADLEEEQPIKAERLRTGEYSDAQKAGTKAKSNDDDSGDDSGSGGTGIGDVAEEGAAAGAEGDELGAMALI